MIDFWEHYGEENFKHPLIRNIRSWNLLFQGVGRAVFDPELEERALFELLNTPIKNWHWEAQTACASFLVSRSKTAHKLLDTSIIEEFLEGPQLSTESIIYKGKVFTPGLSHRHYEQVEFFLPQM